MKVGDEVNQLVLATGGIMWFGLYVREKLYPYAVAALYFSSLKLNKRNNRTVEDLTIALL